VNQFGHPAPLTPEYTKVAQEIVDWAREFLAKPLLQNRPYEPKEVCPFIKGSLDRNFFYMLLHPEINGYSEAAIEELVTNYVGYFKALRPYSVEENFKTILLVFPGINAKDYGVLDKVTKIVKDTFVKDHLLMLAAFYPGCTDKSIHDPTFLISQAPHPLIAIREMAFHDIIFLDDKEEWFDVYNRHFGKHWASMKPETLETADAKTRYFYDRYEKARQKFSKKKTR